MSITTPIKKDVSSVKAWWLAFRPKTLMAAIVPVFVGAWLPFKELEGIDFIALFSLIITSVFLTVATNLINDALDFSNGNDTNDRLGPVRVTQSGYLSYKEVLFAGLVFLGFSSFTAIPIIEKGGSVFILLMVLSILSSYFYSGGPFPLSKRGLGEVFVLVFYGFAATLSSYYLQTLTLTFSAAVAGCQMGLLTTVLIAINNLRDIEEDKKTGKRTLSVIFGELFGKWEITFLILSPFVLNFYWLFTGHLLPFFFSSITILLGINLIRGIWKHAPSRLYNRYLGEASLLLTLFGGLLILGMVLQ